MPKPFSWLLIACLGAAIGACHKAPDPQAANTQLGSAPASEAAADAAPSFRAPRRSLRLAIQLIASRTPARLTPSAPPATDPSRDLYDQAAPAGPTPPADPPGFRITVPMCQRAERQSDPLAKTAECAQLLDAAKAQADACKQAFENGDDQYVLSSACRQAAGFR